MKIELHQISECASEADIRSHHVVIDRPTAQGGSDQGPRGGELFLASVGGCFMSNLLAAIKARDAQVSGVHTEVTAEVAENPSRFASIELHVTAETGDRETLEKLVQIADRACIMMNTLRDKIEVRIRTEVLAASA